MQKKIIAIALASLSGVAFAQSNVTISGQVKVGFENVSAGGAAAAGADATSRTRVTDQNSLIRFAGQEALGNGITAVFQIESAIGTSDNVGTTGSGAPGTATSTGIGTRNTYVGLTGGFGTFLMGKYDAHYNSMGAVDGVGIADGNSMSGNSLNLIHKIGGVAGLAGVGLGGRLNNVVAYVTPNFSGFDALLAYAAGGRNTNEDTTAGLAGKETGWNLRMNYNNGPFTGTFSHLRVDKAAATAAIAAGFVCANNSTGALTYAAACAAGTTAVVAMPGAAASSGNNVRSNRLGAAYTFPMGLKVGLIWDSSKAEVDNGGALIGKRTAWALPIVYTTGPHKFNFTYVKANDTDTAAGSVAGSGAKNTVLGYEYAMSKRTSVAVTYSQINNGTGGTYDFWHPSSNVSNGNAVAAGADPRSFGVTLGHKF